MPKTLPQMEAEVLAYCQAKGWYDSEVTFGEAVALLHEEAAEAGRAWRDWGLEDGTAGSADTPGGHSQAKPEGVGSELADLLIRLLDDDARFKLGLLDYLAVHQQGAFTFDDRFLENIRVLHGLIARACGEDQAGALAKVTAYVFQFARHCGFDLQSEYERKMAYNHTRAYRHGNRRA